MNRHPDLEDRLLRHLRASGITPSGDLRRALAVSQPTLTRLIRRTRKRVLIMGRGRATRYAARRIVPDVGSTVPVFQIDTDGRSQLAATLQAIEGGLFVDSHDEHIENRGHDELPYFLNELRPAGFLGRLVSRRHPELHLPFDPREWSADDCLRYLTRFGWNMPGNFIVGEQALGRFVANADTPPDGLAESEKKTAYARRAEAVVSGDPAGSSAAGEQPKFLATLLPERRAVLVKFSPRLSGNPVARRSADLLVTEHLVHQTLRLHGREAVRSELVASDDRLMLEVDRFDRLPSGGRRGVLSLFALNAEHVGTTGRWSVTARELSDLDLIAPEVLHAIRWLELFGDLIGNTDMHDGNLSFFMEGERILDLTPAYDMVPMFYSPRGGDLITNVARPPSPRAEHAANWRSALEAASELWTAVSEHSLVSDEFRALALQSIDALKAWAKLARRLPE